MTLKEIISSSKNVDLTFFGFKRQIEDVVDGHISYLRFDDVILIDEPAKEWHFMEDGVVVAVGSTTDNSLKKYLTK